MKTQLLICSILFNILLNAFPYTSTAQNSFINLYNINPVPQSISLDRKDILELSNGDLVYTVYDEEICSIIKTDSKGNFIWGKEFSGTHVLEPSQIIELNNTNILVTGRVRNLDTYIEDMALVCLNNIGELVWAKIENEPSLTGAITNINSTSDDNLLITGIKDISNQGGYDKADGFVGKINTEGELLGSIVISNGIYITLSHVQELENGNILLFGQTVATQNSNFNDLILVLLDSTLSEIWSKKIRLNDSFSPFENTDNIGFDFDVVDNNILISTNVETSNGYYPVILSLDMDANLNYVKKYLIDNEVIYIPNFIVNQNNEAIFYGGYPAKLLKINISNGNVIWSKELKEDILLNIMQFTDNNQYLFKQESSNTITIGKFEDDLLNCLNFEDVGFEESSTNVFIEDINLAIANEGIETKNFSSFDIQSFILTPVIFCGETSSSNILSQEHSINIYPNPVNELMHISGLQRNAVVNIYDVLGRKIKSISPDTEGETSLNLKNRLSGILIVNVVVNGNIIYSEKVIIESN